MVKIVKLRDSTYPGQRVERLSCGMKCSQKSGGNDRSYGKELSNPDVVLHCKDHKLIRAHKLVLASISDVLKFPNHFFDYFQNIVLFLQFFPP